MSLSRGPHLQQAGRECFLSGAACRARVLCGLLLHMHGVHALTSRRRTLADPRLLLPCPLAAAAQVAAGAAAAARDGQQQAVCQRDSGNFGAAVGCALVLHMPCAACTPWQSGAGPHLRGCVPRQSTRVPAEIPSSSERVCRSVPAAPAQTPTSARWGPPTASTPCCRPSRPTATGGAGLAGRPVVLGYHYNLLSIMHLPGHRAQPS